MKKISPLLSNFITKLDIVNAPVIDKPQSGSGVPDNIQPTTISINWNIVCYIIIGILVLTLIIVLIKKNKKK